MSSEYGMYLHQLSEVDEENCLRSSIPLAHPLCMNYESPDFLELGNKCIECNIQHTQTHMQKDIILCKFLPALSKLSYILAVSKSHCVTLYY